MVKRIGMRGVYAVALAVKQANPDVIAAYPITPQTEIVEKLVEYIADGELDAEYINVESEHSALSACIGASAMGARVFTATSSQGLALMHEILYIASGLRLPIVMVVANRALSAPLNIEVDHCDSMAERDSGWIQIYVESVQEAYDSTIQAFKIAENVQLPVMVCMDGFFLTHVTEAIEIIPDEDVRKFLPPRKPVYVLDPRKPVSVGVWASHEYYMDFKIQQDKAMEEAKKVIREVNEDFYKAFGRKYGDGLIDSYMMEDTDVALVTIGSMTGTARIAVDKLRKEGRKVGLLRIRSFRPFPSREVRDMLTEVKSVAVISRDISLGSFGGVALSEVRASLYEALKKPHVVGFVVGLGGKDVTCEDFQFIAEKAFLIAETGKVEKDFEYL